MTNFIQKALHAIGTFLGLIKKEAVTVLDVSNKVVNALKTIDGSPIGQIIETAAGFIAPELVSAFKLWLPVAFKSLNWATTEVSKTDEQIFEDALKYVVSLQGDYKAVQLNSLQALIATWLANNTGVELPIQQALTVAQVAHNPEMVKGI